MSLEGPVNTLEAIRLALDGLMAGRVRRLNERGQVARQVAVRLAISRGGEWSRTFTLKEPSSLKERLMGPILSVLRSVELPGPVDGLEVTLSGLGPEVGRQEALFSSVSRRIAQVEEAARQLKARFRRPVLHKAHLVDVACRLPERRAVLEDYDP